MLFFSSNDVVFLIFYNRCQKLFSFEDVIIINPTEEDDQTRQADKMTTRRSLAKKNKKGTKKLETEKEPSPSSSAVGNGETKVQNGVPGKGPSEVEVTTVKGSTMEARSSGSKSNGDRSIPTKKSKLSTEASTSKQKGNSKIKDYSVAKDPKASEAYKSLFTSHKTAQTQEKAHWVTYNPFYN